MSISTSSADNGLWPIIEKEARAQGFDQVGVTRPMLDADHRENLSAFVAEGHHGSMDWMSETLSRRIDPQSLLPTARSVIVVAMNYGPQTDPLAVLEEPEKGAISVYARHRDYHDVMKGRLKTMAARIAAAARQRGDAMDARIFVDTAPLMEKPLAEKAGIGWQGKHTNLVSRDFGSWLFLGSIVTDLALEPTVAETDHCGSCRACLDVCPTNAFPAPYRIDARRCISYLTIENKGPIPHAFREKIGNRIYGCDDCLAVCPWNKFASDAREAKLATPGDWQNPDLAELAGLSDAEFRKRFSGSPVKRIGRDRFLRNVLVAIGNSGEPRFAAVIEPLLDDPSPLVRGAAVWALSRCDLPRAKALATNVNEQDADVGDEWHRVKEMTA